MEHPIIFARRFANLLWLVIHESGNVDEQKGVLRALATQAKEGAFHLGLHTAGLSANDQLVPAAFTGVADLISRMMEHGLVLISTDVNAKPADLLAVARLLASIAAREDYGANIEMQRVAAGASTVHFATKPRMMAPPPRDTPRETTSISIPEIDFGEIYDDPLAEAMARATPRSTMAIHTPAQSHDSGGLFAQFAASSAPTEPYPELLAKLDGASDVGTIDRVLEGLGMLAERAATEGRVIEATDIMCSIVKREQTAEHEAKRAIAMSIRRMAKPSILKAVATQMEAAPAQRQDCIAVFTRAGEEGAEALIELISDPAHQRSRRLLFDMLVQLKSGRPSLLHMLSDSRWFAVRNAAELLGEMQVREAEAPLTELLLHADERVRRAASGALMRLGTTRAMQTITDAMASADADLRVEAAAALASRKDAQAVPTLLKALDAEKDADVQAALLLALGKHGTAEALKKLSAAAAPERRPFMRKSTTFRVAAVHGLAESKAPEALDALKALQSDKETEVANAATFSLRRISRGDAKVSEL